MKLIIENLSYSIDGSQILCDVGLGIERGQFVGLVGPNGSGKSTLLRNIYRALNPDCGTIMLDGTDIRRWTHKQSARKMSVLCQESSTEFDYTVQEMVSMGRAPHHTLFEPDTAEDVAIIRTSLSRVGMLEYAERYFSTLSGGEKQRVLIARALAQQTDFMILDEPTNHLDIHYKLQIMELVKGLGITVLAAIHDLEIACMYCDSLVILDRGRIVASGKPTEVLNVELLERVFRVKTDLSVHESSHTLHIKYTGTI
jgi:iron complex transport system ATP-binding protein